jgi:DNA-binding NarL/FixJ family response regulator
MVPSKQEEIIRVLIVDDHDIIREGLRAVLEVTPDIEVIGEAADGEKAISLTHSLQPDVIVMDLVMPGMDGIEAIEHIAREYPTSRILVLTAENLLCTLRSLAWSCRSLRCPSRHHARRIR